MRNWRSKNKSRSIKDLCTNVSFWAGILSSTSILIFAMYGISESYQSSYRAEHERIKLLLPIVYSAVAGEVYIHDDRAVQAVKASVTERYHLDSVALESSLPKNCKDHVTTFQALIGNDELCLFQKVTDYAPETFVVVRSDVPMDVRTAMLSFLWAWLPLVAFSFFVGHKIRSRLTDSIVKPIEELARDPENWSPSTPDVATEAVELHERLKKYIGERDQQRKEAEKLLHDASLVQWATQVAHDIRSPLTALNKATEDLTSLPEDKRVLLRSAVARIQDIANHLLQKNRPSTALEPSTAIVGSSERTSKELLATLVESLVSEKRLQFRSNLYIEITTRIDANAYGIFADIQPIEFKRLLSNLINNAVEAIPSQGTVEIELSSKGGSIQLAVADNGKGISDKILPALMKKGSTFGKEGGNGFGLYHARNTVESWGGNIQIKSILDHGTVVTLTIPKSEPPDWFASDLEIEKGGTVVIVDDDPTIHQVWEGRFQSLRLARHGITLVHLSTPSQFIEKLEGSAMPEGTIFLVDYELLGTQISGLDLIEKFNVAKHCRLVTSRYEEKLIRERCQRLRVKLIPKTMAGFVPISVQSREVILIDDDPIIHRMWRSAASAAGKNLISFSSVTDFLDNADELGQELPVYLDSNLGNDLRGEDLASQIYIAGFTEIYLVTGFSPNSLKTQPEIRGVLDKTPPWG
jgi:signal transduction histidine kinase